MLSFGEWTEEIFSKRAIYFVGIFIYFGISNCESITKLINNVFPEESLLIMSIVSLFGSMFLNGARTKIKELKVNILINEHNKTIIEYKNTTTMLVEGIENIERGTKKVINLNTRLLEIASQEGGYDKLEFKSIVEDVIKQNSEIMECLENIKDTGKVVNEGVSKIKAL